VTAKSLAYNATPDASVTTGEIPYTEGSVIYNDIVPDKTVYSSGSAMLDLNGDGINEFELKLTKDGNSKTLSMYTNNEAGYAVTTEGTIIVSKLDAQANIGNQNILQSGLTHLGVIKTDGQPENTWQWSTGGKDKYLGVYFFIGEKKHFGWIRLDVASDVSSFSVKSYGYNSSPEAPIKAGVIPYTDGNAMYKDLIPDQIVTSNKEIVLDLNEDGVKDFNLNLYVDGPYKVLNIDPLNYGGYVIKFANTVIVSKLDEQTEIGNANFTETGRSYLGVHDNSGNPVNVWQWSTGATDKYVGVYFYAGNKKHFGWIKLDVAADLTNFTVKSYGYNSSPEAPVKTGFIPEAVSAVTEVSGSDVADHSNGSDVEVKFNVPMDESKTSGYRLFIVPAEKAANFSVLAAAGKAEGTFTTVAKTGTNVQIVLSADAKDSEGKIITDGKNYKAFVLSVPLSLENTYSLSAGSDQFILSVVTGSAVAAENVRFYNTSEQLFITDAQAGNLNIWNMSGVRMSTNQISEGSNSIDISGLNNGLYIVELNSGNNSIRKKIIK
jgi:hypothetical protein